MMTAEKIPYMFPLQIFTFALWHFFCQQQDGYCMLIKSLCIYPQLIPSDGFMSNYLKPVLCFSIFKTEYETVRPKLS